MVNIGNLFLKGTKWQLSYQISDFRKKLWEISSSS